MNSYIVKCNVGKEVRKVAHINFANEDEIYMITREGVVPNIKISEVQIW